MTDRPLRLNAGGSLLLSLCRMVARHRAFWPPAGLTLHPVAMEQQSDRPGTFSRRARLSSREIVVAVALTLAAAVSVAVAIIERPEAPAQGVVPAGR